MAGGRESQQDLFNLLGATYSAVFFLGAANCVTVQPVVSIERTVFYREKAAGMYSPVSYALAQVISVYTSCDIHFHRNIFLLVALKLLRMEGMIPPYSK